MAFAIRRLTAFVLAVAFIVGSFAFGATPEAAAQGQDATAAPGAWQSSINIQNVSTTAATTVTIAFYSGNNATPALTFNLTAEQIAALTANGGSLSLFVPTQIPGLNAGQYSAVVTSDVQLQVVVNTGSTNSDTAPWTIFAYEGLGTAATGTTLFFPGNYRNYFGFNSEVVVQNAGDSSATLTAQFYDSAGTQQGSDINLGTLQPNAAQTFPMSSAIFDAAFANSGLAGLVITSTQPVAGVVNVWLGGDRAATSSYSGFTSGSTNLFVPALYQDYFLFGSALTIQNVSNSQTANVTVTYSNGQSVDLSVGPFAAVELVQGNQNTSPDPDQPNVTLPSGSNISGCPDATDCGVFGATVTSTNGVPIIGLVSLSQQFTPVVGRNAFASYSVPQTASNEISVPVVLQNFFGFFSAVTVLNTSNQQTTVEVSFPGITATASKVVPAGQTANFIFLTGNPEAVLPNDDPGTSVAATVRATDTNVNLVAVIQQNTEPNLTRYDPAKATGDYLSAFSGTAR